MRRFLVTGDWHWRAENPKSRIDDYQAALTAKLYECFDLAAKHQVEAILCGGDVFDTPDVALTTIGDLMRILKDAPCPIFTVPGEHDLYGHNPETIRRTPLGLLFHLGVIRDARLGHSMNGLHLSGYGVDHSRDIDKTLYGLPAPLGGPSIRITHGNILEKPLGPNMRWTSLEEIDALEHPPSVIVNGHIHVGLGIRRLRNTLFINPGALIRIKADLREIDRPVQVALLTIGDEITAELIPLESARPGIEVLSRDHIIAELEKEERRERFTDLLTDMKREALDVTAMVDEVARAEAIDEAVRVGALRRIGRAVEQLAGRAA